MTDFLPSYANPSEESVLRLAPVGGQLVLVSDRAMIEADVSNRFDRQRKHDANFGKQKFLGVELAKFSVSFVVLPDEEAAFLTDVVPLLRPKGKTGASPALDAVNPQINRVGVRTVILLKAKIGPPDPRAGRHITIDLEEWSAGPTQPKKAPTPVDDPAPLALDPKDRPGLGVTAFSDKDAAVAAGNQ